MKQLLLAICVLALLVSACGAAPPAAPDTLPVPDTPIVQRQSQAPQATPTPGIIAVRYVSADGDGLFIRSQPNMEAKVQVWPDGTAIDVLSENGDWCTVRAPDGYVGFMPTRYLSGQKAASVAAVATRAPIPAAQAPLAPAQFSQAEQDYAAWVMAVTAVFSPSMERFTALMSAYDLTSLVWQYNVRVELGIWRQLAAGAQVRTAPPRFAATHALLKQSLNSYARAADLLDTGLQNVDVAMLQQGAGELQNWVGYMQLAAKAMQGVLGQ